MVYTPQQAPARLDTDGVRSWAEAEFRNIQISFANQTQAISTDAPSDSSIYGRMNGAWTVVPAGAAPSSNLPIMDGTASVGVATPYAREDHVHPSDTSRAPLSSPAFVDVPTAPTAAPATNTTQIATTAFVMDAVAAVPGSRVLLNTLTPSGVANIDDTTSITSTYISYIIEYENVVPATANAALKVQVQVGGSFQTTNYINMFQYYGSTSAAFGSETTGIRIVGSNASNNSATGTTGILDLINPHSTTNYKAMHARGFTLTATNNGFGFVSGGFYGGGTGAVTGLRFLMSSGNIASGTIRIYGIVA